MLLFFILALMQPISSVSFHCLIQWSGSVWWCIYLSFVLFLNFNNTISQLSLFFFQSFATGNMTPGFFARLQFYPNLFMEAIRREIRSVCQKFSEWQSRYEVVREWVNPSRAERAAYQKCHQRRFSILFHNIVKRKASCRNRWPLTIACHMKKRYTNFYLNTISTNFADSFRMSLWLLPA